MFARGEGGVHDDIAFTQARCVAGSRAEAHSLWLQMALIRHQISSGTMYIMNEKMRHLDINYILTFIHLCPYYVLGAVEPVSQGQDDSVAGGHPAVLVILNTF